MRRRRITKAAEELRYAPESPCHSCGRMTKTTSDGVCAECWGSKGGRAMGWKKEDHLPGDDSIGGDDAWLLGLSLLDDPEAV